MTNKFKVGDKIRKIRSFVGTEGVVVAVSNSGSYIHYRVTKEGANPHGPRLNRISFDFADNFELIPSEEPRLFRKGDKVTVTYEVVEDQKAHHPANSIQVLLVKSNGFEQKVFRTVEQLRHGKLEPAPEPPYVPKPGDLFRLKSGGALYFDVCRCLFVDEKSLMYESGTDEKASLRQIMNLTYHKNPVFERV